jgi:hypothetical protein
MTLLTDREAREWIDRANTAEAEVERLRKRLAEVQAAYAARVKATTPKVRQIVFKPAFDEEQRG